MDPWDHHHHRLHHPSFSSTLLDHIYRSIDDSSELTMRNTKLKHHDNTQIPNDYFRSKHPKTLKPNFFNHSTSSSSESSNFSSSESDSFYRRSKSSSRISLPKPIRTTVEQRPNNKQQEHGSFLKTKSKAYLKKVKQPISPGGRLATFLNSIFTGNTKRPSKINTTTTVNTPSTTTCSSASSFSRSCLSKTPSSTDKSKRSVRFCPVNVIFDEEDSSKKNNNKQQRETSRHHHHQNLEIRVMEENRRVIEAAKELLRIYQKKKISVEEEEEDDDDDDAVSCASSDLFELDNLSTIGIERYQEELPVYETTNPIISR